MIRYAAAAMAVLAGGAQDSGPSKPPLNQLASVQVVIREQIIVRVPRGPARATAAASSPVRWRETRGPRCVPLRLIAGAMPSERSVDLVLRDNRRMRLMLGQNCPGLNYYRGMYLNNNPDGMLCASRDVVRSRMGGECSIVQFRGLHPERP